MITISRLQTLADTHPGPHRHLHPRPDAHPCRLTHAQSREPFRSLRRSGRNKTPTTADPATLALYLRYYGWEGDQHDIADMLKPYREDRNVNVEELHYYAQNRAGWLNSLYRVGGDLETIKKLLAAGIPVMIEESFQLETRYWPNDDQWAAHYNLVTGYDDATQTFTTQDSYIGPDQKIPYEKLNEYWRSFNRVYILLYPPDKEETVKAILGRTGT